MNELPLRFRCNGDWLYGMLHPAEGAGGCGVLVVVGGPQYRIGSHRQFLLLARALAASGIPVMRFDYRGMGDSEGEARDFEHVATDIRVAIDEFFRQCPDLERVAIWGLCDAASAALFYAHTDARVGGIVLLNPWVRTEAGLAQTYLRHYYLGRLLDRNFWLKVLRGEFDFKTALGSFVETVAAGLGRPKPRAGGAGKGGDPPAAPDQEQASHAPLPERMLQGLQRFSGPVLLILSGDDLTANEFKDLVSRSRPWRRLLQARRVTRRELDGANHTFSTRKWRDQVAAWTRDWVRSACPSGATRDN